MGPVARTGELRNAYNILVGRPEAQKQLGKPMRRWDDNIRRDLRERGWEVVDWIHLTQGNDQWRNLVNTVLNLQIPQNAGNFLTS